MRDTALSFVEIVARYGLKVKRQAPHQAL